MLQQLRFCIYKGKINVKLPNAFKCLFCNVLYIFSVHVLLNLGADAKNYLFPRFMTESSQGEILNNSMLKIQYKHESLIFFARRKTRPYRFLKYNAMLLNWMLVYLKYFLNSSTFSQFVEFTYAPFFPIQRAPPLFPKHCFETQV